MGILSACEPKNVFRIFEEICAIPHGSGNTQAISDYCEAFAKARGFQAKQDAYGNVIILKPASKGYEQAQPIIIQGHLDMVCEKDPDCQKDMSKEGLTLTLDGDWISAQGTTLGGDDGVAVAMALALLEEDMPHPALEILLTTDEETGMDGAQNVDLSSFQGRQLLNLDCEEEGVLVAGCAGSVTVESSLPVHWQEAFGKRYRLSIEGLKGGHSGVEIEKGLANANQLMGRLLHGIYTQIPFQLQELSGGTRDNVIAFLASAVLLLPEGKDNQIISLVNAWENIFQREYQVTEPELRINVEILPEAKTDVLPFSDTEACINLLLLAPYGVEAMSMDIPGLVQTSCNPGIVDLREDGVMVLRCMARSSLSSQKEMMEERIHTLTTLCGGTAKTLSDCPPWEFRSVSPFRDKLEKVYAAQYGEKPKLTAVHGGLECSLFTDKIKDLDCVSLGPNILDIHSPRERLSVSSTERVWRFLCEVLKESK